MSLAEANQILLTRAAFDNARPVFKGEDLEDIGALGIGFQSRRKTGRTGLRLPGWRLKKTKRKLLRLSTVLQPNVKIF